MTWIAVILLAVIAFAFAAFLLRLERQYWAPFATVLTLGLAGYALQASPDRPSSPKTAVNDQARSGEAMVAARRALFDPAQPPPSYLTVSDGFARQGRFEEAAQLLRSGTADNPGHGEGWLALANALVEHAEGQVTPAALYAYANAEQAMPGNPGPAYFLGVALLRSGMPGQARQVWLDLLENAPEDAPWRDELAGRIEQLDNMLRQIPLPGG